VGRVSSWLRKTALKPVEDNGTSTAESSDVATPTEDDEAHARSADDRERLIGLLAAPFAAAIGILVIRTLIVNDPPALLKNGQVDSLHVSLSLYHDLDLVLLALSTLMLLMAMLRKRLHLGIVMALYGLAVFNLQYWGFGLPFIMAGAWLLVRAYRIQRDLREANQGLTSRPSSQRTKGAATRRA